MKIALLRRRLVKADLADVSDRRLAHDVVGSLKSHSKCHGNTRLKLAQDLMMNSSPDTTNTVRRSSLIYTCLSPSRSGYPAPTSTPHPRDRPADACVSIVRRNDDWIPPSHTRHGISLRTARANGTGHEWWIGDSRLIRGGRPHPYRAPHPPL